MNFFRSILVITLYCLGLVHAVSCSFRIGRVKKTPVFPGQIWDLPGAGHVLVTRVVDSFTYYEVIDHDDRIWYCRTSTFRDFARIVTAKPAATPIEHLISTQESNVIHLKKDNSNDRV